MNKNFLLFALLLLLIMCYTPLIAGDYKIITDMDDNKIEVPANPKRIACMHSVSAERIIILGKGDRLVLSMKFSPWAYSMFPEVKDHHIENPHATGNLEKMLKLKVDLVLYSPNPAEAEKYKAAGLKTACGFSAQKRPRTMDKYIDNFKRQFLFFGDLLGPDAKSRADKYCEYFDNKIKRILSITSKIDMKDRLKVYFGGRRGGGMLSSQGKASVMHWNTEVSGGNFLPQAMDNNFVEVSMEQVFSWDPDIILISGWGDSIDEVKKDSKWASLRAVKNGKLYHLPMGVFPWDHASGESILLMIYMAKIFHPDLIKDWDMIKEMKLFYSEVYGKNITDKDAERILQCLPPE
ncbi:MAG: ABC transporter substrate-binding protein [Spirochaetota bacterium]